MRVQDLLGRMARPAIAGAVTGIAFSTQMRMLQPDAAMARSRSGERMGTAARVQPAHVAMGRELTASRFSKGNWWVWQYTDGNSEPTCWERYEVTEVNGDEVCIDMASKLRQDEPFSTHHRMHLSLSECLAAHDDHRQWNFRRFGYLRNGRWMEAPYKDNVQAFEEKFNGHLMVPESTKVTIESDRSCNVAALGEATLVRSTRHAYTGAWYVEAPAKQASSQASLRGVAGLKFFGKEGDPNTYRFELLAAGTEEDAWLSDSVRLTV